MKETIFWISFAIILYIYFGYGTLLFIAAKFLRKAIKKADFMVPVNVVIVAHNEEANIKNKIINILSQDYPNKLLKLIIVSDGSRDRTADIVREFKADNVELIEIKERVGKAEALNRALSLCDAEFVVLADSRQEFEKAVLKELISNFKDENVGAVSGELLFRNDRETVVGRGLGFYWNYEKFLRNTESKIDSTCGATGAIYAIRKKLFRPIPADTLLDDVVIPMNIVMQGYRCIFEPVARAFDSVASTPDQEARRKIRTIAGNFQMFFRYWEWLNPFKNRIWFQTVSHKFLRLVAPVFLVAIFISNLMLINENTFFKAIFYLQIFFYSLGFIGIFLQKNNLKSKLCSIPLTFIMLNFITVRAFWEFLFKKPQELWRSNK